MIYIANFLPRETTVLSDGRQWRGPNALGDMARTLIGEGADPGAQLHIFRDGRLALEGTIGAFAARQWSGNDADPQFRRWRPHPQLKMPPRLVAWATENGFMAPQCTSPTGSGDEGPGEGDA